MTPAAPSRASMFATLTAVVPTLGRSPALSRALEALREDARRALGSGPRELRLVLVAQELSGTDPGSLPPVDHRIDLPRRAGFAASCNLGIAACEGPWVVLCNDDAVIEPGWTESLLAAIESAEDIASVQGLNLAGAAPATDDPDDPEDADDADDAEPVDRSDPLRVDGAGLTWNGRWQAIQIGHGESAATFSSQPGLEALHEVFGVSATAALYRRTALDRVSKTRSEGGVFAERLVAYYEDVEVAGRLRGLGYRSLVEPHARAFHVGSATASTLGVERWSWLYGNRYLALADLLGRGFWPRLPALLGRDVAELAHAFVNGPPGRARGVASGWLRALRHLPAFARLGPPRASLPRSKRTTTP